jgi:vitellogenic carboxypeptidase-like protein
VLFVDQPIGVGFSVATSKTQYIRTESQMAQEMYNALLEFYNLFPTYANRPLYLAGESYAGISKHTTIPPCHATLNRI